LEANDNIELEGLGIYHVDSPLSDLEQQPVLESGHERRGGSRVVLRAEL
jgi:hypothetical protein